MQEMKREARRLRTLSYRLVFGGALVFVVDGLFGSGIIAIAGWFVCLGGMLLYFCIWAGWLKE